MKQLIFDYETYSNEVKSAIFSKILSNMDIVIENATSCPTRVIKGILKSKLEEDTKYSFLLALLPIIDVEQCKEYLSLLKAKEYLKIFNSGNPKFPVKEIDEEILKAFENRTWIKSYYEKDGTYRVKKLLNKQ